MQWLGRRNALQASTVISIAIPDDILCVNCFILCLSVCFSISNGRGRTKVWRMLTCKQAISINTFNHASMISNGWFLPTQCSSVFWSDPNSQQIWLTTTWWIRKTFFVFLRIDLDLVQPEGIQTNKKGSNKRHTSVPVVYLFPVIWKPLHLYILCSKCGTIALKHMEVKTTGVVHGV